MNRVSDYPPDRNQALEELRAIRRILGAILKLLNEFCGAYLNARFQYGKPTDRWSDRPRG